MELPQEIKDQIEALFRDLTEAANKAMGEGMPGRLCGHVMAHLGGALEQCPENASGQLFVTTPDGILIGSDSIPADAIELLNRRLVH